MKNEPGRNALCKCGSGKKYKQCCLKRTTAQPAPPINLAQWMQEALAHHRAGRLTEAQALYQRMLEYPGAQPDVWHLLGLLWHARGELTQALAMLDRAVAHQPANAAYCVSLGLVLQAMGRPAEAKVHYRQAISSQPDHAGAHNNLGNALEELGQQDEALVSYHTALRLQADPVIHYNLANVLQKRGNIDQAIDHYRRALVLNPAYAEAWGNLGSALQCVSRTAEAIVCYQQAIASRADYAEAHNNLGNALKEEGRLIEAAACYRHALALREHDAGIHNNLGHVLKALGQVEDAVLSYTRAIARNPDYVEAMTSLAGILQEQGKTTQAIVLYQRILALKPDVLEVLNNLGCAFFSVGQIDEAADCYCNTVTLHPDSAQAHYNLGGALQALWRLDEAVDSYRHAIELKPDYAEAHNNLGNAFKALEQFDAARNCYQRALELDPQSAQTCCNLAILDSTQKHYEQAERGYRQTLALAPDMVVAHRNLAALLAQDGRIDEARQHMDHAYRQQCWFHERRHGVTRTVLILLGVEKGNVPFAHLFPPERNNTVEWIIDYAPDPSNPNLPDYDLVFNALGEPDMTGAAAEYVRQFVQGCERPVLNPPSAIARTSRDRMHELFGDLDAVLVPTVWRMSDDTTWPKKLTWPAIVRPAGSHGGEGMIRLDDADALKQWLSTHPGQTCYLSRYHDYRSTDGYFRKYRMIFINGIPYPYHLAISSQWMVHYATAEMLEAWKLAEEQQFLADPVAVLGQSAIAAIAAIGQRLGLDFAGADFSLLPDGRILLFEANATMLVHPEQDEPRLMFKNVYVERIYAAFDALLAQSGSGLTAIGPMA